MHLLLHQLLPLRLDPLDLQHLLGLLDLEHLLLLLVLLVLLIHHYH